MTDFDYSQLDEEISLTLETEDGESIDLDMLFIFEYDAQDYASFLERDNEDNVVYFFAVNPTQKKNDEVELNFEYIDDEELATELLDIFQQIVDADADEDADIAGLDLEDASGVEEDDDDDKKWDEFIHKKLN
ncbi:MAG: DUF1292 domain-containing protein [Eubacterium sp.]|nr:DUF1292 domain-containing protein [Eubacterium sp.]